MDTNNNIQTIKQPLTYEEQINLLKSRNLLLFNEEKAIQFLKGVNYYRWSAYTLSLKRDNVFKEGVTFEHVCNLYEFDKKLRHLLIPMLERVEILFRTRIAYHIAHQYGALGYEESTHFENIDFHQEFMNRMEDEIKRNKRNEFILHHKQKYGGQIPIWVAVEVMSFGVLSMLFSNMRSTDKKSIAEQLGNIPSEYIESWLVCLAYVRNVCAHFGRLYNKKLAKRPKIWGKDRKYLISYDQIFSMIFVIKKFLVGTSEWTHFVTNLEALVDQYEEVELNLIGFPVNWREILRLSY
ncbi:Abi family protein [Brevibacillus dissolubilis]|uniref:Abi family protein n=1 Tax=Brevibacillus dissolubilis TaxID=1844116 RepID=UPI00159BA2B8|nr:Abi family protein [Brevibacillus dissolubilis]